MSHPWLCLLPPALAIALALRTRQVILSLSVGIFSGWLILASGNPFSGLAQFLEALVHVFKDPGNTKVILFCGLVGGFTALIRRNGGVAGFIAAAAHTRWLKSPRSLQVAATLTGILIFVETTVSSLIVGAIFQPLFEKKQISPQKLAYICDSTSAPVNLLIPLNAWGAFIIGLLAHEKIPDPLGVLIAIFPINFYALLTIAILLFVVISGKDIGPMYTAEKKARQERPRPPYADQGATPENFPAINPKPGIPHRFSHMAIPILVLIIMMPVSLLITGKGIISAGSGATSVLWAVTAGTLTAALISLNRKTLTLSEVMDTLQNGVAQMLPVMILMMLAFALGDVTRALNTGPYIAQLAALTSGRIWLPALIFIIGAAISFATGTSWGNYAIMIPIAVPLAIASNLSIPLTVSAVLSGGLFGDHCSPISDTTIVSAMASNCELIEHVRTQLPYALLAAAGSTLLFLIAGFLLS